MEPTKSELLLPSSTTEVVVVLTIEQRLANIERAMRSYIDNPPLLPDAEILSNKIAAVDGKVESALAQVAAVSDTLPGRVGQIEQRMSVAESNIQAVAQAKHVQLTESKRDTVHENAHVQRNWKCTQCGSGTSDVVRAAARASDQRSCGVCGGPMIVTSRDAVAPNVGE